MKTNKGRQGGARPGAGRKKKVTLPRIRKDVAFAVAEVINAGKSELNPTGQNEVQRWIKLLDSTTESIRLSALREIKHSIDGIPKQKVEEVVSFDPNQPMVIRVEHIGGAA